MILVIGVSMDGADQYLSINTKTKFTDTLVVKIKGGCNTPPLVRRVTKHVTLVRRGLKRVGYRPILYDY